MAEYVITLGFTNLARFAFLISDMERVALLQGTLERVEATVVYVSLRHPSTHHFLYNFFISLPDLISFKARFILR